MNSKENLYKLVNRVSNEKLGKEVFVDNKLNLDFLMDVGGKFIKNNFIEVKGVEELVGEESDIKIINDTIIIENSVEEYTKFIVSTFFDELESGSYLSNLIYSGQHDDRVAKIITAQKDYELSNVTLNKIYKLELLKRADGNLILGMTELEKQIQRNIELIQKVPVTFIDKIFKAKIKLEQIDEIIANTREALNYYENAIKLMLLINSELYEVKKIDLIINKSKVFIKNVLTDSNCERLINFDIEEDNFFINKRNEILSNIEKIKLQLDMKKEVYILES